MGQSTTRVGTGTESLNSRHLECVCLLGILALGAGLRLFRLSHQSLWLDEAFSAILAGRSWGRIVADTARDTMPPLYYFFLNLSLRLGKTEFMVRLPSALFAVSTLPLLYALGKRLYGAKVGLVGALMLAVNPFHVFYAQEARMYTQLGFFTLLSAWCFWEGWQSGRWGAWLGFVGSSVAALYTHNMAVLLFPALGLFALFHWRKALKEWRVWLIAGVGILLLVLPWLLVLPDQVGRVGTKFWLEKPSVLHLFTTLALFLFGYALPPVLIVAALVVGLFVVFLTLPVSWRALQGSESQVEAVLFVYCLVFVPMIISFLISLLWPVFLPRTFIISALALVILIAWEFVRLPWPVALGLAVLGLALAGISLHNFYVDPAYAKPPIRSAASYLCTRFEDGDVVIHTSDSSYLVFAHYVPELEQGFIVGDPDYEQETTRARTGRIAGIEPRDLAEITRGKKRLWVVMALDHNIEHQQTIGDLVAERYSTLDVVHVEGIQISLYDLTSESGK